MKSRCPKEKVHVWKTQATYVRTLTQEANLGPQQELWRCAANISSRKLEVSWEQTTQVPTYSVDLSPFPHAHRDCWLLLKANYVTCCPIPELSANEYCANPNIVLLSHSVVVNGFVPRHNNAHFLSLTPGWQHTMTNTTHVGDQAEKRFDTWVIHFCQKHRNSHPTPPGVDKAGMHSLGCRQGGM